MASRPYWKGYLKLSLVTCPVSMSPATSESEKVRFHTLNRETGNRVISQYVDAVTRKPVKDEDEVKGYARGENDYVLLTDEELDAVTLDTVKTIDIDKFVPRDSIEWIYLEKPHYLVPDDPVGHEAFAVIRDALSAKKKAGLARIVLYRRERPAVIEPLGKGMMLTTLRYDSTVRQPGAVFDEIKAMKTDKEMIDLAVHIIDRKPARFDPSTFDDKYEEALLELIRAKKAGRKAPKAKAAGKPSNVVNLFDALKKSLASDEGEARPPKRKAPAAKGKATPKRKSA